MKSDTRKPSDTRAADTPALDAIATPAPPAHALSDLSAMLAAIQEQEAALAAQKAQLRKAIWEDSITKLHGLVQTLSAHGYDLPQIGKALGFTPRPSRPLASSSAVKGPSTNAGWFQLFRSRSIQQYLKSHPELAHRLKASQVPFSACAAHLPVADLAAIDAACQSKADAKCPPVPAA